jgi:hypothetical protein
LRQLVALGQKLPARCETPFSCEAAVRLASGKSTGAGSAKSQSY